MSGVEEWGKTRFVRVAPFIRGAGCLYSILPEQSGYGDKWLSK